MALTQIDDRGLKTPIDLIDNEKIRLGTGNDLELYHDGSNSYIQHTNNGASFIVKSDYFIVTENQSTDYVIRAAAGTAELYYNNSKKFETASYGAQVFGNLIVGTDAGEILLSNPDGFSPKLKENAGHLEFWTNNAKRMNLSDGGDLQFVDSRKIELGTSQDLQIYHDGSNSYIKDTGTGNLKIDGSDNVELQAGGSTKAYTYANGLFVYNQQIPDNGVLNIGNGSDLKLYHNGSHSYIINGASSGTLNIRSDSHVYIQDYDGNTMADFNDGGAVELYYDGTRKLETFSGGVQLDDDLVIKDTNKANFGDGYDLKIYHDAANIIESHNGYTLFINKGSTENMAKFIPDGGVELYHNNSKVFETLGNGVRVQGGVMFGSDTADSNRIDDYEEGTFTPTIRANANTNGSQDGTGSYVKVGKKVTIHVNIGNKTLTGFPGSGPGTIRIDGLPFVSNQANGDEFGVSSKCIVMGVDNNSNNVYFRTNNGQSYLFGYYNADGSTWVAHDAGFWDNSGVYCIFNMTYFTNS